MNSDPYRKRLLVQAAATGGQHHHGSEEHDRGVEVQHRGHHSHQPQQHDEQHPATATDAACQRGRLLEHAVVERHPTDQ